MQLPYLTALLSLVVSVSANTVFQEVYVNGVSQGHTTGIRMPPNNQPVEDLTSPDIICNTNSGPAANVIEVPAGSNITAEFHHKPTGATAHDSSDPLDPTDKGPVLAYMAKIMDATQADVSNLGWFKIWEDGLTTATHQWATDRLFNAGGKVNFTIPSCIEPGDYLLRVETIGLQYATFYPGAEFWLSCAQLRVSGSGTSEPETVSFPGAYQPDSPGITASVYSLSFYDIPGPPVFTC